MASRRAVLPSRPYSRAAKSRFSIGLSFLKNAASTLTRLIRRLTAISSRSMSWPKTSTRPLSRVSSPLMRRMSVDLPEPLAPRIPWMSPRSRRSDTSEIATTGLFFRPTTNRLLTSSMRRAGTADVTVDAAGDGHRGRPLQLVGQGGGHWCSRVCEWWRLGPRHGTSRGPRPTVVGWPRGSWCPVLVARWGREGHQKSRGPDLAHGSGSVRKAVLPPAASSRWAQISRDPRRRWAPRSRRRLAASSFGDRLHVS